MGKCKCAELGMSLMGWSRVNDNHAGLGAEVVARWAAADGMERVTDKEDESLGTFSHGQSLLKCIAIMIEMMGVAASG